MKKIKTDPILVETRCCNRCSENIEKETDKELSKEYPYYCPNCDENMYGFETYIKKLA